MSPSRLEELSSDDDTQNDSKASPVQREYTQQELIAWALIIVILVISVIACYLLWAKANGTV